MFLVTGWWLSRSQMDQRVVGWWRVHMGETAWPVPIWEFRADGTAVMWHPTNQQNRSYAPNQMFWRSNGDRLIFWNKQNSLTDTMSVRTKLVFVSSGGSEILRSFLFKEEPPCLLAC
jgi:hypothetical protein